MKSDYLRAIESFALRAFLIAIGFQLFALLILVFGSDKVAVIQGAIIGIEESRMEQFKYDVKLQFYLFLNLFKIAGILLFGIPWAVLRFSKIFRDNGLETKKNEG
ncbi:MAG TPA: hypothetical protein EYG40_04420 [Verrucomicrobia bacterium]|jgi:hypothetical protein|nr:hypothetical protein [Verrucomicrobiales bacterium]HIL54263.1 hypothetical protein [Verrucomicrobiota bacterium]